MKKFATIIGFLLIAVLSQAQLTANITTTVNTNCTGTDCFYDGPSILINEMMLSPSPFDGSLWQPNCSTPAPGRCGEWIELYNPNICEPVDVSCYRLGNNANDGGNFPGGYTIPAGTIIPPRGFLLLRGQNAPPVPTDLLVQNGGNTVEIVVNAPYTCIGGGSRLWFPNAGGWFAFYNQNGEVQDAVSWASVTINNSFNPCVVNVGGCTFNGTLDSYDQIPDDRKTYISTLNAGTHLNQSLRRFPDGGPWQISQPGPPTYGNCNGPCANPPVITCNGTATVTPTSGTPPYTYQWNDSQAQLTATATGLCAGTYNVTVTDANGAQQVFQAVVEDFIPTVTNNVVDEVCIDNGILILNGGLPVPGPGDIGTYSGPGVVGNSFDPTSAGVGTHTITYTFTDEFGCTNSATDDITVNPLPIVNPTSNSPLCQGETLTLGVNALPNATYSWTGPNGFSASTQNTNIGNAQPNASGVYTVQITDENGCINSQNISIVINTTPIATATSNSPICQGETLNLNVGNIQGATYSWSGPNNFNSNNQNPTLNNAQPNATGSYTVTITSPQGCTYDTTFSVVVNTLPQPTIGNVNSPYCNTDPDVTFSLTPTGGTLTGNGISNGVFSAATAGVGTHPITYTYTDNNGCTNSTSVTVEVIPGTPVQIDMPDNICVYEDAIPFQANPSGGSFLVNGASAPNFSPSLLGNGIHTVQYTFVNNQGCVTTDEQQITVNPRPNLSIDVEPAYCTQNAIVPVNPSPLGGTLSGQGVQGNGINLGNLTPGTYTISYQFTDNNGCENTITEDFQLVQPPAPLVLAEDFCFQTFKFTNVTATTNPNIQSNWTFGSQGTSQENNPVFEFNPAGQISVTLEITDEFGCKSDTTILINVEPSILLSDVVLPNVISPNGDGINDIFVLPAEFDICLNYRLTIFNRWGNQVFEIVNSNTVFAGNNKSGNPLVEGVYYYILEADRIDCNEEKFKRICTGNITIVK